MNLIKWTTEPPQGYEQIAEGTFYADMGPVLARLMLKIPNGEYVVRELQKALILSLKNNPDFVQTHNLDGQLYYMIAEQVTQSDGKTAVPFSIFAQRR